MTVLQCVKDRFFLYGSRIRLNEFYPIQGEPEVRAIRVQPRSDIQWEVQVFLTDPPGCRSGLVSTTGEVQISRLGPEHRFGTEAEMVAGMIQAALRWDTPLYECLPCQQFDWAALRREKRLVREYRNKRSEGRCWALLRHDPGYPRPFLEKVIAERDNAPWPTTVLEAISDVLTGQPQGWEWLFALQEGIDGCADTQRSYLRERFEWIWQPDLHDPLSAEVCLRSRETGETGLFNLLGPGLHRGEASSRFGLIDTFVCSLNMTRHRALQELLADWLSLEQKELLCWADRRAPNARPYLDRLRLVAIETAPEQFHLAVGPKSRCQSAMEVLEQAHAHCPFDLRRAPAPVSRIANGAVAGLARVIGKPFQQQFLAAAEQIQAPGYYPISPAESPEDLFVAIRSPADTEEYVEWSARGWPGILHHTPAGWYALTAGAQTFQLAALNQAAEFYLPWWRPWLERNALLLGGNEQFSWSLDWQIAGVLRTGQKAWCIPHRLAAEAMAQRKLPPPCATCQLTFWPYLPADGRYPFHLLLEINNPRRYIVIGIGVERQGEKLEPFRLEGGPAFNVLPVTAPQGPIVLNA